MVCAIDRRRLRGTVILAPGVRRSLLLLRRSRGSERASGHPDAAVWSALLGGPAISVAEQAALAGIVRRRRVPAGGCIFARGDRAHALVGLREGDAALGLFDAERRFHCERPVAAPGWLDQSAAWSGGRHVADARALTDTLVWELPCAPLQALLPAHPSLARRLLSSLAGEVIALRLSTQRLMHQDAAARFAAWLLERCPPGADEADAPLTIRLGERKRDIASQLAVTPETLSRLMRQLVRRGVISVRGYTVQVSDVDALRRAALG